MMNEIQKETFNKLQKYAGKIAGNDKFLENYYNTLADIYVDELLKLVSTDENNSLTLTQLREQLADLHQLGELKNDLIHCSVQLLGFTEDVEIENFITEETEYMQIVKKEFDDVYTGITTDNECLMDMFTHELKNRRTKTVFPQNMRVRIETHIDWIATSQDNSLPKTLDEWIDRICEVSGEIDLISKLVERTEMAYDVLRGCLDDYLSDPVSIAYNSDYANAIINKAIHLHM